MTTAIAEGLQDLKKRFDRASTQAEKIKWMRQIRTVLYTVRQRKEDAAQHLEFLNAIAWRDSTLRARQTDGDGCYVIGPLVTADDEELLFHPHED